MRKFSIFLLLLLSASFVGCLSQPQEKPSLILHADAEGIQGEAGESQPKLAVSINAEKIKIQKTSDSGPPTYIASGAAGAVMADNGDLSQVVFRIVETTKQEMDASQNTSGDGIINGALVAANSVNADGSFEFTFTRSVQNVLVVAAGIPNSNEASSGDIDTKTNAVGVVRVILDFTGDGCVSGAEWNLIQANFHQHVTPFTKGDANGDGYVSEIDSGLINYTGYFWSCEVPSSLIEMKLLPDQNKDGCVNQVDLTLVDANLWKEVPAFTMGDVNGNGRVEQNDRGLVYHVFWNQCGF